jgi:hypothetical protein
VTGARFCGLCGARLGGEPFDLPQWQRPAPAKYRYVVMNRIALNCPGCGAELVMIPRLLHPNHMRVYVKGLRAGEGGFEPSRPFISRSFWGLRVSTGVGAHHR